MSGQSDDSSISAHAQTPVPQSRDAEAGAPSRISASPSKKPSRPHRFRKARASQRSGTVLAALDLGTNNCRLLIARPRDYGFQVIDAFSRTVCLGESISDTGELQPEAIERTLDALQNCVLKMERRGVTKVRSIATEACRAARNGDSFIARIRAETGLDFEVISPAEEARLAVMGCWPLVDRTCESALVFDIGGGSTELIWLDVKKSGKDPHIAAWTSLNCGVMSLAERFGNPHLEPPAFEPMVEYVMGQIKAFKGADGLRDPFGTDGVHLVGTSGTVTTLAGLHLELPRYERDKVDGIWMTTDRVREMAARVAGASYQDRAELGCVGADRADFILAGCAILEAIQRLWPAPRLRVADRGLREGVLLSLMDDADMRPRA